MTFRRLIASLVAATALIVAPKPAHADRSTIKSDTDHPSYFFEAEPHAIVAPFHKDIGFGPGFEGTFNIVDQGFIRRVNDSALEKGERGATISITYSTMRGARR